MVQEEDPVQRVSQGFQSHVPAGRFQLAFPYRNAMPPHHSQFLLHPLVPLLITYYLCMPVLCSRLGHHKQPAPLVSMPEAPVHKDARPVFPQHYVRFPGQSRMVEPISKAMSPQEFPHQHFRLRILALYRSHAPVPLFRSQFVHSGMGECYFLGEGGGKFEGRGNSLSSCFFIFIFEVLEVEVYLKNVALDLVFLAFYR